jgi:uncharacterized protein
VPDLSLLAWAALAIGAITVGISKTAIPGANIAVVLFAAFLPAKESTAALLLLLILADVFAVVFYRRHADWSVLRGLIPPVVVGLVLGAVFLNAASDTLVARVIGAILISVIALGIWQRRRAARREAKGAGLSGPEPGERPPGRGGALAQRAVYGSLGGFTTMVANAAGPVMSMYFLAVRMPVATFLGTSAWFYFVVNLSKVPFSAGLGLFSAELLLVDLVLVPFVVLGALGGRAIAQRMSRRFFEWSVIVLSVLGAVYLLLR